MIESTDLDRLNCNIEIPFKIIARAKLPIKKSGLFFSKNR